MMIQSAPAGEPRFICTMKSHNALCAQFVHAFGNAAFEKPEPFEEVAYAIGHHDRGWDEDDANPVFHPESGFPCGLGTGPAPGGKDTSRKSPDFNQRRHAYCGLLSSMHSWGLYNERYGFTEFRVRQGGSTSVPIPPERAESINAMLEGELARQEKLKAELAADPATRGWVEEKRLMQNYKLLQFCDTLALYFNLRHSSEHGEETYVHVPQSLDADTEVTLTPAGDGSYRMSPFPFAGERLDAVCQGRYFHAIEAADAPDDMKSALYDLPEAPQTYSLLAG